MIINVLAQRWVPRNNDRYKTRSTNRRNRSRPSMCYCHVNRAQQLCEVSGGKHLDAAGTHGRCREAVLENHFVIRMRVLPGISPLTHSLERVMIGSHDHQHT